MKAEIEISGTGRGRVVLDDADVSAAVRGLTIRAEVGRIPQIELDLSVIDVTGLGVAQAEILIPDATREALIALGWTPPADR